MESNALANDHCDEDFIMGGYLTQLLGKVVVLSSRESIELLRIVNRDDGKSSLKLQARD